MKTMERIWGQTMPMDLRTRILMPTLVYQKREKLL